MIKLFKADIPEPLATNAVAWTQVLIEKRTSGIEPTPTELSRYRHPDIKSALLLETHGKCAYCESKICHITYGDIEHISPKSIDPERIFDWENLTISCDTCNTNKGNKFPFGDGLINPYIKSPSEHFRILGSAIVANPGDDDARLTEMTLKLNRVELMERRQQKINYLRALVEVIARAPSKLRPLLIEDLQTEASEEHEYSAIALNYLSPYLSHDYYL